jgi:assimilatory nitrate reductase electron transfer subunit
VLAATLADLGVDVRTGASLAEVVVEDGVLHSVRLDDGLTLPTDLLLVSTGVRPRTELARAAGLPVGQGIRVGHDQRSPDDGRVFAIGDCAEPPDGCTGLVGPGWEQATRLAAALTGTPGPAPAPAGSPPVRLKAAGVDLVTMGLRGSAAEPGRDRVVTVSDPVGRRHLEVVVRGGRLAGVTCVGAPDLAASLSVAYDRGTPLPSDPLALLLPEQTEEDGSPALMPAGTPVCRCNGVAKRDIVGAWEDGARTVPEVATATRATTGCGGCRSVVCGLVDWLTDSDPDTTSQPGTRAGEKSFSGTQHEAARDEISAS